MLIEDSPVRIELGALVALEPSLTHLVRVFGVGVIVKVIQIFVLPIHWKNCLAKCEKITPNVL